MKWCIPLAFNPESQWTMLARTAEEVGFEAAVISDHLLYPARLETPYPYTRSGEPRWAPETSWPDPLIAVAALASATTRLRFITSIFTLPLRHPVAAAKQIATAEIFSDSRLVLGLGVGWMKEEFDVLGARFDARGRRMEEMIEILEKLWQGGMVAHEGEFYRFPEIMVSPTPISKIPLWGGGTSRRALERAGRRFDGWLSEVQSTAELQDMIQTLQRTRAEAGRSNEPFAIHASVRDAYRADDFRRLEDLGVTHVNVVPWLLQGMTEDDVHKKCDGIRRFAEEIISRVV